MLLDAHGFQLASESHVPEAFGSAEVEYKRRTLRVRLTWDGKDRWLWCKVAPVPQTNAHPLPNAWRDLESVVGATPIVADLREDPVVERRIRALERALQTYLTTHASPLER